jgi:hypothetical protein
MNIHDDSSETHVFEVAETQFDEYSRELTPGWYFWDETDDWQGPFDTRDLAIAARDRWYKELG